MIGTNAIEVIDGQQRMTTLSLLMLALARAADENGGGLPGVKLIRDYLLQEDDAEVGRRSGTSCCLRRTTARRTSGS